MGYWGHGIMDGDTPLDVKWTFDERQPKTVDDVVALFERFAEWGADARVALGELIIDAQLPLPNVQRAMVITALEAEYDQLDSWREPSERREALDVLKARLDAYPKIVVNPEKWGN